MLTSEHNEDEQQNEEEEERNETKSEISEQTSGIDMLLMLTCFSDEQKRQNRENAL